MIYFFGAECGQFDGAFEVWQEILDNYPSRRIIELGTWKGGFSAFLLMQCKLRGMDFHTLDIKDIIDNKEIIRYLGVREHFHNIDIFSDEGIGLVRDLIKKDGRTILFCDNGNKPKEFNTFAKFLKVNDIICVHDWGDEIHSGHIEQAVKDCNLKQIKLSAKTNFFLREK